MRQVATRVANTLGLSLRGTPLYYAELDDPAIHGEYIGVSTIESSRGHSFDECMAGFSIHADGIKVYSPVRTESGAMLRFTIHYPPSWVFHLEGWGVDHMLAVRQKETSTLAQFLLHFSGGFNMKADAAMILGEGMPALLGVFVRIDGSRRSAEVDCEELFKIFSEDSKDTEHGETWRSFLPVVDLNAARQVMDIGSAEEKQDVLRKIGRRIAFTEWNECVDLLTLIERGLNDPSPRTQREALDVFICGGRVVQGIAMVKGSLNRPLELMGGSTLEKAVEALTCLLYEAWLCNVYRARLIRDFQTDDIVLAHTCSSGVVSYTQYEAILDRARRTPAVLWAVAHQEELRAELERVRDYAEAIPQPVRDEASRALAEYPVDTVFVDTVFG